MSRDDGFRIADLDVSFLEDPKFRSLIRSTRDEATIARCVAAYVAVLTASWETAERVPLAEAAPLWLTGLDDLTARMAAVGLLDADGRISELAWINWFYPAARRRDDRRIEGAVNGLVAHGTPRDKAESIVRQKVARGGLKLTLGEPRPVPSVPSVPPGLTEPLPTDPAETVATDSAMPRVNGRHRQGAGEPSLIEETDLAPFLRSHR